MMSGFVTPLRFGRLVLWAMLSLPLFLPAQTDRPCGAPFMNSGVSCSSTYKLMFTGSSFQADAPLPVGCTAAYSTDVWVQVVAPSATPYVSVTTLGDMFSGGAPNPTQLVPIMYSASPDCNNLVNAGGCPNLCSIGLICIEVDGLNREGQGIAWRFSGLTTGATYWLRLLWNPTSNPVPDTARVSIQAGFCAPCDPCGTPASILAAEESELQAEWQGRKVALDWYSHSNIPAEPQLYHSTDALNWELRPANFDLLGDHYSFLDAPEPSPAGHFYQVRQQDPNGMTTQSNIVQVMRDPSAWLRSQVWHAETLELETLFEGPTTLRLHDPQGRLLWQASLEAGAHKVHIPRELLSSGLMFLRPSGTLPMAPQPLLPY